MSRNDIDNRPFIETVKELPTKILELGYNPIDPRIINSRTGIYMSILALFRLPEAKDNLDFLKYLTSRIGKDLSIDPYELLTPNDYATVTGAKKLEYRTNADTRAFVAINELINECKSLNRELLNLSEGVDFSYKTDKVVAKATSTFKRIVSLKEFSFGGAYLLDEDVYEKIREFTSAIDDFDIISTSNPNYSDASASKSEIDKLIKSSSKLESLKNDGFKKLFFAAHASIVELSSNINKSIDNNTDLTKILKESIKFTSDFVERAGNSSEAFDTSSFGEIGGYINKIISQCESDIDDIRGQFTALYKRYLSRIPEQIKSKGNVNPAHIKNLSKKYKASFDEIYEGLDKFIMLNQKMEFSNTYDAIRSFYSSLSQNYTKNKSFKDSVDKSFKIKTQLKTD